MEIMNGFIYFKRNGKIEVLELPEYGTVTIKAQDGLVVVAETLSKKQFKK